MSTPIPEDLRSMHASLARVGRSEKSCGLTYTAVLELIERIAVLTEQNRALREALDRNATQYPNTIGSTP